ncbi:efflux transporter outer membrane subunit [Burkholderiales bacterium]|nr:efflux transporter outer membrane subunit [Burkholderiales bacterium]
MNQRFHILKRSCTLLLIVVVSLTPLGCAFNNSQYRATTDQTSTEWANLGANGYYQISDTDIAKLEWWKSFKDPILVKLIEQGLKSNHDISRATSRILQAQETLNSVRVDKNPKLNTSITNRKSTSSEESGTGRTSTSVTTQFQTSWELDLFGKFKRSAEAAEANVQLEIATMNGVKIKLISTIVESYISFRATTDEINLNHEAAGYLKSYVELAELEAQAGVKSIEAVQIAKIRLANLETSIVEKKKRIKETLLAIDLLLGTNPGKTLVTLDQSTSSLKSPSTIAISIPAETILQRPDIQEALQRLQVEAAKVGVAEAQRYPTFSFTGSIGLEALAINSIGNSGANFSTIQTSLLAPIFNSGALKANVNAQIATRDAALETYRKSVATGLNETEQALLNLNSVRERLKIIAPALRLSKNHVDLTNSRYETGIVNFKEVLKSREELNVLKQKKSSLIFDELQGVTQLYKVLGGGWAYETETADI